MNLPSIIQPTPPPYRPRMPLAQRITLTILALALLSLAAWTAGHVLSALYPAIP